MTKKKPEPWTLIRKEEGPDLILFKAGFHLVQNPRNGLQLRRLVLDSRDWVNVVAVTKDKKIIIVDQYRFGTDNVTAEIPGGVIDPGETHRHAGERELREETGYTSKNWRFLGPVAPNPAFQNNLCYQWLAKDAEKTHDLELDKGEDIRVRRLSLEELRLEIKEGRLWHSLALSALSRVFDLWSDLKQYGFDPSVS